jgi:hypothetical protein
MHSAWKAGEFSFTSERDPKEAENRHVNWVFLSQSWRLKLPSRDAIKSKTMKKHNSRVARFVLGLFGIVGLLCEVTSSHKLLLEWGGQFMGRMSS